jgi:hypothetical protein
MAVTKKKPGYYAKVGIDFEGLKGKPRVEAGDPVPEGLKPKELEQLEKAGMIEKVEAE